MDYLLNNNKNHSLSGCITTDRIAMRVSHTKTAVLGIDDLTVFVEVSQYE
jgi:hypothetical protein